MPFWNWWPSDWAGSELFSFISWWNKEEVDDWKQINKIEDARKRVIGIYKHNPWVLPIDAFLAWFWSLGGKMDTEQLENYINFRARKILWESNNI